MTKRAPRAASGSSTPITIRLHGRALLLVLILPWGPVVAGPDGEQLYARHCAACHGNLGQGGIGLPLALSKLIRSLPDSYLETTIRRGRPGRVMPAFEDLGDAQVQAIVAHLRGWTGGDGPVLPDAAVTGDAARGSALYAEHCSACHGEDLQGGIGTGRTFSRERNHRVMAPALANPGFLAAASDQFIKRVILHGRQGTAMLSFRERGLSERDAEDIVVFIRGFQRSEPADATPDSQPGSLVAVSPHGFEETVKTLQAAIKGMNFRTFSPRYFEQGLVDELDVNDRQVTIRFCNFARLYEGLKADPRLGMVLPCRITVLEQADGSVLLVAMNLHRVLPLFNNDRLQALFQAMQEAQQEIFDEVTM
jgi:cytochrome c oxidase cbb3-type subunit 3